MTVQYLQPGDAVPEGKQLLVLRSTNPTALHLYLGSGDYIRARSGDTRVALTAEQAYAYKRLVKSEHVARWFADGVVTDVTTEPPPAPPEPAPEPAPEQPAA